MKNFGEKEASAYPGTAQFCWGTPYYLRNGKSYEFQIWPLYWESPSEQNLIKNFAEKGTWAYPATAQFFRVPLLSQEREKLRISNLASTFRGSIRTKVHWNFLEKRERGRIQGLPNFFPVPPIISGKGKAMKFKFCTHIFRLNRNKSPLKNSEKIAVGVVRDSRKFSGHSYIRRIARSPLR